MAPNNAPLQAFGCDTPQRLFRARCQAWGDAPALRHKQKGIWASTSWMAPASATCEIAPVAIRLYPPLIQRPAIAKPVQFAKAAITTRPPPGHLSAQRDSAHV